MHLATIEIERVTRSGVDLRSGSVTMERAAMDAADNGTASDVADMSRGSTKEKMGHGRVVNNDPADFKIKSDSDGEIVTAFPATKEVCRAAPTPLGIIQRCQNRN